MTKIPHPLVILGAIMLLPSFALSQDGEAATAPISSKERAALAPDRPRIELGRNVAEKACAECQGMDGAGPEPAHPHLAGQRTVYLYRVLQAYQARARRNDDMYHAGGFLNDEALLAVSAFYASLAPVLPTAADEAAGVEPAAQEGAADPFADLRGALKKCVKCHGEDGNAPGSGMPNLTAQDPQYFLASMQAYAEGARSHNLMRKLVADLDEQTLSGMAVFYAVQEPLRKDKAGDGDAKKGAALAEPCATCYGADGNANGADMPTLAGQYSHDPGVRCAMPVSEPLDAHYALPQLPARATVLAADGSQIAPDRHAEVEFGLINVGVIRMDYGSPAPPVTVVRSQLFYEEELYTSTGMISDALLALRRDLNERTLLARMASQAALPAITFTDGLMEHLGRAGRGGRGGD